MSQETGFKDSLISAVDVMKGKYEPVHPRLLTQTPQERKALLLEMMEVLWSDYFVTCTVPKETYWAWYLRMTEFGSGCGGG